MILLVIQYTDMSYLLQIKGKGVNIAFLEAKLLYKR